MVIHTLAWRIWGLRLLRNGALLRLGVAEFWSARFDFETKRQKFCGSRERFGKGPPMSPVMSRYEAYPKTPDQPLSP